MQKEQISFIINPISGTQKKISWPQIIRSTIDSARFDIRVHFTERAGHAFELACREIDDNVHYIIAVGGDGTANEVAAAVRNTSAVMGIVPCGSGNGLARHLHIPLKLTDALTLINNASTMSIDYGTVNDRPFFCTFGIGFDAHVSHRFALSEKRGFRKYLSIILREYLTYRPQKYKLKIDGSKLKTTALMVTVANSAQFGNNGYIAPFADITDGRLDVCLVRPFPKIQAFFQAIRFLNKRIYKSSYYRMIQAERMTIKSKHPTMVHLDGEPHTMDKKIKIKIVPQGLNVLVGKR